MSLRIVHYINQFFAQIGGEEKADIPAELREGIVGPGSAFQAAFKGEAEIVATIICGDSYFGENESKAKAEIIVELQLAVHNNESWFLTARRRILV